MGICYVIGAGDFGDGPLEPGTESSAMEAVMMS